MVYFKTRKLTKMLLITLITTMMLTPSLSIVSINAQVEEALSIQELKNNMTQLSEDFFYNPDTGMVYWEDGSFAGVKSIDDEGNVVVIEESTGRSIVVFKIVAKSTFSKLANSGVTGRLAQGGLLNTANFNAASRHATAIRSAVGSAANRANVRDHLVNRLQREGCPANQARNIAFAVDQWIKR